MSLQQIMSLIMTNVTATNNITRCCSDIIPKHVSRCFRARTSHQWIRHVTRVVESRHRNEWAMSHVCVGHVRHLSWLRVMKEAKEFHNTLQHTATRCNTLQHTATHCSTLNTLQHTATHCTTLQLTATHIKEGHNREWKSLTSSWYNKYVSSRIHVGLF